MSYRKFLVAAAVIVLGLGIGFSVSNLFQSRPALTLIPKAAQNSRFVSFSKQLQVSCMDCHTQGLTQYPFYYKLPIAKQIIAHDIEDAQSDFDLPLEKLRGEIPFSNRDLLKIKEVLEEGEMPPLKYTVLHWNARISEAQKDAMLAYINALGPKAGLIPLTEANAPKFNLRKAELGKALYFDTRLSGDNSVSCASCHALEKGGADQAQVATGIRGQKGPINSPTVLNAALNFHQFWDGRAKTLQEQAGGPVNNPKEMGSNWPQVFSKLNRDKAFKKKFSSVYSEGFTANNITEAIAEYEKTLVTVNSPYDRYLLGDNSALTPKQIKGHKLFVSNNCISCHSGVNLGGESFEKMGRQSDYFKWRGRALTTEDLGRFGVTKRDSDRFKFKVPTLRNIEHTYPYFHDGSTSNLTEAVQIMAEFQLGKKLSQEDADAIADFLKSTSAKPTTLPF